MDNYNISKELFEEIINFVGDHRFEETSREEDWSMETYNNDEAIALFKKLEKIRNEQAI